ncbi:MAG: carbamoyltransferase [Bryobacteraceae bacterium]|nr:carbamoyltransferase [Bryobacteraceae bacterium]MDW8377983.1 carbamoyltransferase C-terminal domain-containing protein [Bryobacterales bacterium]
MNILGIGGIRSDASCALLQEGHLRAAVEEKKIARRHHPGELPEHSIAFCLSQAKLEASQVHYVALARPIDSSPESKLHLALRSRFPKAQVILVDHHTAHAAAAYYVSPFEQATVLTLDCTGDFRCGALWNAQGTMLHLNRELYFPDSLGHLYGRVTELLGYRAQADEHKVQWLSASGDDRFVPLFREILPLSQENWPRVDRSFFDSDRLSHGAFSAKFYERLGLLDNEPVPGEMKPHLAAGLQRTIEQVALEMAGSGESLCLGGGLALNALLIAAFERSGRWRKVYVQPVAGNAGTALGAATYTWHGPCRQQQRVCMEDLFLGPSYSAEEIKQVLENCKLRFQYLQTTDELVERAVGVLGDNKIVAWFQGRMEMGPRALGHRSILASPLDPYSTENLNEFIKHREPFRKFAASVPEELASDYFDVGSNARYLATVGRVRENHRKTFEAALLGPSGAIRVHTVSEKENPVYWRLLHAAGKKTGLPVLYNTSFNLFGEPLVCSPRDAVRSFYSSGIDAMFVGSFFLEK